MNLGHRIFEETTVNTFVGVAKPSWKFLGVTPVNVTSGHTLYQQSSELPKWPKVNLSRSRLERFADYDLNWQLKTLEEKPFFKAKISKDCSVTSAPFSPSSPLSPLSPLSPWLGKMAAAVTNRVMALWPCTIHLISRCTRGSRVARFSRVSLVKEKQKSAY